MSALYIGLMSGTSCDGIDAVLVDFAPTDGQKFNVIATHYEPLPSALKTRFLSLIENRGDLVLFGELDQQFAELFSKSVHKLLQIANIEKTNIQAIGLSGHNVWHQPSGKTPFTLQIGNPHTVAQKTGITTIADFRRCDLANGGQGAPLAPAFHQWVWGEDKNKCIVNIGGIANVTFLAPYLGFDTGPGNGLMDAWAQKHVNQPYDKEGLFALKGQVDNNLLNALLSDPYFSRPPPKSTGKEYFNLRWLEQFITSPLAPEDIQATLMQFTAKSIEKAIKSHLAAGEVLLCGGGVHNTALVKNLTTQLGPSFTVKTTEEYGLAPDWLEAICFAWLAHQRYTQTPITLKAITGAEDPALLGILV